MKHFLPALKIFALMTVFLGLIYPLFVTVFAQVFFKEKANGSLITKDGKVIGSSLIAQNFKDPKYFWPRPSAVDFNPMPSGGSNLGPTSSTLKDRIDERRQNGLTHEMLFTSASGLDPHISLEAAIDQIDRIIRSRTLDPSQKDRLMGAVNQLKESRDFGILGEPRINVLKLNLFLEKEFK